MRGANGSYLGIMLAMVAGGAVVAAGVPVRAQDPFTNFLNALGGGQQQQQQQQQQRPQRQQQQQQPADPFGQFMQGLFGAPAQQAQPQPQPGAKTIAPGTGDPIASALRQIDMAREIQAKAVELERNVFDVVNTVKVYQAANGAMWLELGKQLSALNKLDEQADSVMVKQFVEATQRKRDAYRGALRSVVLNPSADIAQSNQTLAANTQKVATLRQSVAALVEQQARPGAFDALVRRQDVPLDAMMSAYMARIEDAVATMDSAAKMFADMSTEYQSAQASMSKAITTFERQGELVAGEASKQVGVLALEIARMSQIVGGKGNDAFSVILGVVQGVQILQDMQSLSETLGNFQKTQEWFDQNAKNILAASQGARQELVMSSQTIKGIQPKLMDSWKAKVAAINAAAAAERKATVKFDQELAKSIAKAKAKAPAMAKQELEEMNSMKRKNLRS